jgi:hypothetical protein
LALDKLMGGNFTRLGHFLLFQAEKISYCL